MMTTTELAAELDTTPRVLRKFLRSKASGIAPVGKGSRYSLPSGKRDVAALRKRFDAWGAAQVEARRDADPTPEVEVEVEVEAIDEVEGPTPDELEAIDAE